MRDYIRLAAILLAALTLGGCGGDDPQPQPPEPDPTPVPPPDIKEDPNALYNGIALPAQWPPRRNYASDIRLGMTPYYLTSKPEVIKIGVGRQLFVDDFLVASTTLTRRFHYPEYHGVVLEPDRAW